MHIVADIVVNAGDIIVGFFLCSVCVGGGSQERIGSHSSPEERTGAKIGLISSGSEKFFMCFTFVAIKKTITPLKNALTSVQTPYGTKMTLVLIYGLLIRTFTLQTTLSLCLTGKLKQRVHSPKKTL